MRERLNVRRVHLPPLVFEYNGPFSVFEREKGQCFLQFTLTDWKRTKKKKENGTKKKNDEEKKKRGRKVVVCKPINFHPSVGCTLPSAALQAPHLHTGA